MEKISVSLGILLLLSGLSDADEDTVKLSLLVGDSATLNTGIAEISSSDTVQWMFENERIAEIRKGKILEISNLPEIFEGRLQPNNTTGSLNITNINSNHNGAYMVEIRKTNTKTKTFIVTVTDGVKNVSVMKGDSVTLHTGVTGVHRDAVKWKLGNQDLKPTDEQTGDLTITHIGSHQSGNYSLEINNSRMGLRRTYVVVVIDKKPEVSVKEGKIAVLVTGLKEIQPYGLKLNFKGRTIAEIDKNGLHDRKDDRLLLDNFSGYLIISDSATTDTGVYSLTINSSTYSLQRTISVTVSSPDSGVAAGAEAGIVVGLLVFLWCLQL